MPKIDLYPDSKSLIYPPIQGKENRLPQRPINSAIGTGGLDFLIACALLILCHSLFKVVIEQIAEWGKIVVALVAVHTVVDCDIANIALGKETLGVITDFQIIPSHAGHILDDNGFDLSRFRKTYHLIPAGSIESYPGNAVINEKGWIWKAIVLCILQKDFFLRRDLSRVLFTKKHV